MAEFWAAVPCISIKRTRAKHQLHTTLDIVTLFKQKMAHFIFNIDHYYHFNATVSISRTVNYAPAQSLFCVGIFD